MIKNALLTLISLAFVAGGVFLLLRGDTADAALAWGCIAFFGACALSGVAELWPSARAKLDRDGALTLRPRRTYGTLIAALGMGLGCYLLAPLAAASGDTMISYIAYFGAFFFGVGGVFALWRTATAPPIARLDASGVEAFGRYGWKLQWREVVGIGAEEYGDVPFLLIMPAGAAPDTTGLALNVAESGLAFEDVRAIAEQLWARHRAG